MEGDKIYQTFSNQIDKPVILVYTKLATNTPTTTFKLYKPGNLCVKINHNCTTIAQLAEFLFVFSTNHAIFFDCFDIVNGQPKRNTVDSIFPQSHLVVV